MVSMQRAILFILQILSPAHPIQSPILQAFQSNSSDVMVGWLGNPAQALP
jgi:hypothetical protein